MNIQTLNKIFKKKKSSEFSFFFSLYTSIHRLNDPLPSPRKREKKISLIRINNKTKHRSPINPASRYKSLVAVERTLGTRVRERNESEQRMGVMGSKRN